VAAGKRRGPKKAAIGLKTPIIVGVRFWEMRRSLGIDGDADMPCNLTYFRASTWT